MFELDFAFRKSIYWLCFVVGMSLDGCCFSNVLSEIELACWTKISFSKKRKTPQENSSFHFKKMFDKKLNFLENCGQKSIKYILSFQLFYLKKPDDNELLPYLENLSNKKIATRYFIYILNKKIAILFADWFFWLQTEKQINI